MELVRIEVELFRHRGLDLRTLSVNDLQVNFCGVYLQFTGEFFWGVCQQLWSNGGRGKGRIESDLASRLNFLNFDIELLLCTRN